MRNATLETLGRALASLAMLGLLGNVASAESEPMARTLSDAMRSFAATLDEGQRDRGRYAFDDDERFDLRLAPIGLEGLRVDEMSDPQWQQLHAALGGVLSADGLRKVDTIRSLEREVAELESGFIGFFMRGIRDPRRYFLALFGEPSREEAWGLRFDGHHLSLNWTTVPGAPLSVTPLFLGGQPREVPEGLERAGLRVLALEEDRAVALVLSLSGSQRTTAAIPFVRGGTSSERGPRSGDPFYYRIQGETLLIEFDDTSAEADHVHVVWRELQGDFGRDLLSDHHRAHHPR